MTYCLGWKNGDSVIVAADSALTSNSSFYTPSTLQTTSFGELRYLSEDRVTEERGLKIFCFKNAVLTCAGKSASARGVVEAFKKEIEQVDDPVEALKTAIGVSLSPPYDVAFILGTIREGQPVLVSFNEKRDGKIVEHDQLVQLGSAPEVLKEATSDFLLHETATSGSLNERMVSLLAILQSYGQYGPFMSTGVGGAFTAAAVNRFGTCWQPDIMFMACRKDFEGDLLVTTCVRHECLLLDSPAIPGSSKCLANVSPSELFSQRTLEITKRACEEATIQYQKGKFDYVVIMNGDFPNVIVLDMSRKHKHNLLWIDSAISPDGVSMSIRFDPKLMAMRDVPLHDKDGGSVPTFNFLPYQKPLPGSALVKTKKNTEPVFWESKKNQSAKRGYVRFD